MRVALMSYDERELRVRKFYLEEQSRAISCTCFQSGEPVLEALRKAWCFDVLVLSGQLEDMDSLTFIERLNQLPNRPALLLQGDGWYDDHTMSCLKRSRKMFCIEHGHLQDLMRGLLGSRPELHPDRALLHPTVRAVGHPAAQHQLRISDAGVTDRLFSRWKAGAPQRNLTGRRG